MNEIIKTLKENGYKAYASQLKEGLSTENGGWVFAVTPSNNILYIQRGQFGGWEISLEYKPSRKNGSGCRANDTQPYSTVTVETLQETERENLSFARKLGATLYKTPEEWINGYWTKLIEM